jgi:hypothetical protein
MFGLLDPLWEALGWSEPLHDDGVRELVAKKQAVRIADVEESSRACIVGIARASVAMYSPMTNQLCAGWFISIDEVGADSRWAGAIVCHGDMFVDDESGSAQVVFENARFGFPATFTRNAGMRIHAHQWTATERDAFDRAKVALNYPASSTVRFREHAIIAGQRVCVFGHAQREPDPGLVDADKIGYRGDAPTRPVFSGTRKLPVMITDTLRLPRGAR